MLVLKESLDKDQAVEQQRKRPSFLKAIKDPTAPLFVLQWFVSISLAGLEATFAYFADDKAGLGTTELGYIFMIMGLAGAVVQGGLVGKMTKKIRGRQCYSNWYYRFHHWLCDNSVSEQLLDGCYLFNDFRNWKWLDSPCRFFLTNEKGKIRLWPGNRYAVFL